MDTSPSNIPEMRVKIKSMINLKHLNLPDLSEEESKLIKISRYKPAPARIKRNRTESSSSLVTIEHITALSS